MPGTTTAPLSSGIDDLDDLFNYDVEPNHASHNQPAPHSAPARTQSPPRAKPADLGIDEEIQVAKKRKPIAKLDENRLLSQAGIPKLRRITKERLKFKGKGHEYTDLARLLNLYQLWLDDLYPRAKFADGLAMIEKLGHTRRLQTMRREWIREGKPVERESEEVAHESGLGDGMANVEPISSSAAVGDREDAGEDCGKDGEKRKAGDEGNLFVSEDEGDELPEDDELDALLAEDALIGGSTAATSVPVPERQDEFEDELEAMVGMEDMW